jgi:hypothetical protein
LISVKRLAVFHDGGQSEWLDNHTDGSALKEMLERLARPASEPFERAPVIVPEVIGPLRWGLGQDDDEGLLKLDIDLTIARLREASEAIFAWARHLRHLEAATSGSSPRP